MYAMCVDRVGYVWKFCLVCEVCAMCVVKVCCGCCVTMHMVFALYALSDCHVSVVCILCWRVMYEMTVSYICCASYVCYLY